MLTPSKGRMAGEGGSEVTGARRDRLWGPLWRIWTCLTEKREPSHWRVASRVIRSDFHFRRIPPSAKLRINCRRQDRNQGDQLETISRIQWEVVATWTRLVAVEG